MVPARNKSEKANRPIKTFLADFLRSLLFQIADSTKTFPETAKKTKME